MKYRRVLMVSPHFPPDSSAGTHRVRLLAPHLEKYAWEPTVLTVEPQYYEGRIDPELEALTPKSLRVERCPAWSAATTRRFKLGDLGLRAYSHLRTACRRLLGEQKYDAVFITVYPVYPALLGGGLKRQFGVAFVLDYQDPWVGAWGATVGGGPNGLADWKSRWSRRVGLWLEPRAVRAADAVTAVSAETFRQVQARYPNAADKPFAEIPIGGEAADFDALRNKPRANPYFDSADGDFHLCYVGTLLPLGFETLRAVLNAVRALRDSHAELYGRLRLRFFGTSNQTSADAPQRVTPIAEELGVADRVTEVAPRIGYLDALTVQTQASALLLMGSSEAHYTASKLYPALLAKRPLLAAYHRQSTVSEILARAAAPPSAYSVAYDDDRRAEATVADLHRALVALLSGPGYDESAVDFAAVQEFSAANLAGKLADMLTVAVQRNSH